MPSDAEVEAAKNAWLRATSSSTLDAAFRSALEAAEAVREREVVTVPSVDALAQIIRTVDGNHSLGAGKLAEEIVRALSSSGGNRE